MLAGFLQMDMKAGVAYGVIVDGFDGKFGTYDISIKAFQVTHPKIDDLSTLTNFNMRPPLQCRQLSLGSSAPLHVSCEESPSD